MLIQRMGGGRSANRSESRRLYRVPFKRVRSGPIMYSGVRGGPGGSQCLTWATELDLSLSTTTTTVTFPLPLNHPLSLRLSTPTTQRP